MIDRHDIVIVGGGHGGAQTAIGLRQRGYEGSIAIVGDETWLPYERPPLSKEYLAGEKGFDRIMIRPAAFWAERKVDMLLGQAVVHVDADARRIRMADGREHGYGTLVWAAGGAARRLSCDGHDLAGVHSLRTRDDCDRLAAELGSGRRVVIVGGGYIGMEAASALIGRGCGVTLLEAQDRILSRVAGEALSSFFEAEHRSRGVDLRTGVTVSCLEDRGGSGRVSGVRLADGEVLAADIVIVGVGIVPAVDPLRAAGADTSDGVVVDAMCRTSLPDIFAIGDCAAHPNVHADGAIIRLESVQNAADQAGTVAGVLTGAPQAYTALPWFWSNQYDLKLQTLGLARGHDQVVVRGEPAARRFSVGYFRAGRLIAIDCVNAVKDYVQARALILGGQKVDADAFADASRLLKSIGTA